MKNNITNHTDLSVRLIELRLEKAVQEAQIKQKYNELASSFDMVSALKSVATNQGQTQNDWSKVALNSGIDVAVGFLMSGNRSFKSLVKVLFREAGNILLQNNNIINSISALKDFFVKLNYNRNNDK